MAGTCSMEALKVKRIEEEAKAPTRKHITDAGMDVYALEEVIIPPHTIKVASMFSVMSRLKDSNKCDLLTKMKIYNGEDIIVSLEKTGFKVLKVLPITRRRDVRNIVCGTTFRNDSLISRIFTILFSIVSPESPCVKAAFIATPI